METREGLLVAVWTEKVPPQKEIGPVDGKNPTSALDCAAKSMRMASFALTFFRLGGR